MFSTLHLCKSAYESIFVLYFSLTCSMNFHIRVDFGEECLHSSSPSKAFSPVVPLESAIVLEDGNRKFGPGRDEGEQEARYEEREMEARRSANGSCCVEEGDQARSRRLDKTPFHADPAISWK